MQQRNNLILRYFIPQDIFAKCTMAHKRALDALDGTSKDLRNDSRILVAQLLCYLAVSSRLTAADEINACLKPTNLWCYVKILQLAANMRVALLNDPSAEDFSEQSVMAVFLSTNRVN